MFNILVIAMFVGCAHGFAENAHLCDEILKINCKTQYHLGETDETVCASNNNTYQDYCEYSQARCTHPKTHISYVGQCVFTRPPVKTTTTTAAVTIHTTTTQATVGTTTIDELMTVFCASKGAINCPTDLDPMCGSDGNFYLNKCEFSKQTCDDPTLTTMIQDACIG